MAKWRECQKPTCTELVQFPERYCAKHKLEQEQQREQERKAKSYKKMKIYNKHNRERNDFYQSKQWKQTREYVINRDHYVCQVCGEVVTDRKIIDHIIPLRIGENSKALDENNLWTLCYRCHTYKTQIEEQILNSPNGRNKVKHISKDNWKKYIKGRIDKER